jgi:hypothetical protein
LALAVLPEQALYDDQGFICRQLRFIPFDLVALTNATGEDASGYVDVIEHGEAVAKVLDVETLVKKLPEIETELSDLPVGGVTRVGAKLVEMRGVDAAGKEVRFRFDRQPDSALIMIEVIRLWKFGII